MSYDLAFWFSMPVIFGLDFKSETIVKLEYQQTLTTLKICLFGENHKS